MGRSRRRRPVLTTVPAESRGEALSPAEESSLVRTRLSGDADGDCVLSEAGSEGAIGPCRWRLIDHGGIRDDVTASGTIRALASALAPTSCLSDDCPHTDADPNALHRRPRFGEPVPAGLPNLSITSASSSRNPSVCRCVPATSPALDGGDQIKSQQQPLSKPVFPTLA